MEPTCSSNTSPSTGARSHRHGQVRLPSSTIASSFFPSSVVLYVHRINHKAYWGRAKAGETIYLSLHCHHQNDSILHKELSIVVSVSGECLFFSEFSRRVYNNYLFKILASRACTVCFRPELSTSLRCLFQAWPLFLKISTWVCDVCFRPDLSS